MKVWKEQCSLKARRMFWGPFGFLEPEVYESKDELQIKIEASTPQKDWVFFFFSLFKIQLFWPSCFDCVRIQAPAE